MEAGLSCVRRDRDHPPRRRPIAAADRQFPRLLVQPPVDDAGAICDDADHRLADLQHCARWRDGCRRGLGTVGPYRAAAIRAALPAYALLGLGGGPFRSAQHRAPYRLGPAWLRCHAGLADHQQQSDVADSVFGRGGARHRPRVQRPRPVRTRPQSGTQDHPSQCHRAVEHSLAGGDDRRPSYRWLHLRHFPCPALFRGARAVRMFAGRAVLHRQGAAASARSEPAADPPDGRGSPLRGAQ